MPGPGLASSEAKIRRFRRGTAVQQRKRIHRCCRGSCQYRRRWRHHRRLTGEGQGWSQRRGSTARRKTRCQGMRWLADRKPGIGNTNALAIWQWHEASKVLTNCWAWVAPVRANSVITIGYSSNCAWAACTCDWKSEKLVPYQCWSPKYVSVFVQCEGNVGGSPG